MTDDTPDGDRPVRRDGHEGDGATRGTSRMEAFADAVFAIAFTLPVVEIRLPSGGSDGSLLDGQLLALWPSYLGYLLSSLLIGLYWVHHHFSGAIYRTTGHMFLLATLVFLTMIGFIAFPARMFAEHLGEPAGGAPSAQFLIATLAATALAWLLKWRVGRASGHIDARLDPAYVDRLDRRYVRSALLLVGALALSAIEWRAGLALAAAVTLAYLRPPETPRYTRDAPEVNDED